MRDALCNRHPLEVTHISQPFPQPPGCRFEVDKTTSLLRVGQMLELEGNFSMGLFVHAEQKKD